jgi:tRNA (guanosine-2'-O-)-methyltransferase
MSAELIEFLSGFVNERRLENFKNVLENRTRYIKVACEDVYQGHNASALLRTCDCLGIQDFHIIQNRNRFEVNPEIEMGASKWLSMYRHCGRENQEAIFSELRSSGYRVVATTPDKNGISLQDLDLKKGPLLMLFGTEKKGLSDDILHDADEIVRIEMYGFTESFNVSVSAGIILHYLRLKLNTSEVEWRLGEDDKKQIMLDWLRRSIRNCDLIEKEFNRHSG